MLKAWQALPAIKDNRNKHTDLDINYTRACLTDEIEEESNDRQTNPYFIYSNRLISLQKAKTGHNTWIIINSGFLFYFLIVFKFWFKNEIIAQISEKEKAYSA